MMGKLFGFVFFLLLMGSQGAPAQEDAAPFGLTWMATSAEIQSLGVTLAPVEEETWGKSFVATNLPKGLSDLQTVFLSFGYDDALWRVAALGKEFENDKYGSNGKARYEQLASSLQKSYELIETHERPSTDTYYSALDKFAYSLSENEAWWYSTYKSPSANIELSLDASYEDTYWRLIYTHRGGEAAFEAGKSDAELDAL